MEFKGTSGKWNIHEDNEIGLLIGGYNPISDVCTVHRYGDKTEENANAKLIASAPELLEACESMLKAFNNAPKDWLMTSEVMDAEKQMANAIAKALQP